MQELGLALMVSLAFPERRDDELFLGDVLADLCHHYLLAKWISDPAGALLPQSMKPIYVFRDPKVLERNLKDFDRRIQNRLYAAKMAIAPLQAAQSGQWPPTLPKHINKLSLAQLSDLIYSDTQNNDPANIHKRIWQPSLPVIHLAAALVVYMNDLDPSGSAPITVFDLIQKSDFVPTLLRYANEFTSLLLVSKDLSIRADQLIAFPRGAC